MHHKKTFQFITFLLPLWIFTCLLSVNTFAQIHRTLESPKQQIIYFDLPSQSLKNGLIEFAIQSKLTVIVESKTVDGYRSKPIIGPYYAEGALKLLLSKSPLTYTVLEDSESILIQHSNINDSETNNADDNDSLDTNNNEQLGSIQEIIVRGTQHPFRYNTISNTQIYGNTSTFSSARFINTLPGTLVTDQKPDDLNDLLRLSSGITPGDGMADSNDDFYLRGFSRGGVYLDGFRLSENTGIKLFTDNIDHVEILKGPSTLFYGQAEPGGIVNAVRKKPLQTPRYNIRVGRGSNNEQHTNFDFSGPVIGSKNKLRYRLITSQISQDEFRDLSDIERKLISSSLTWQPSNTTSFNLSYDELNTHQVREQGTVILAPLREGVDVVSVDRPANQARPDFEAKQNLATLELQHYFASGWSIKSTLLNSNEQRFGIRANREALFTTDLLLDKDDLDPERTIIIDGVLFQGTEITKENQWLPLAIIHSIYDEESKDSNRYFKTLVSGAYKLGGTDSDITIGLNWENRNLNEKYILEFRDDLQSLELSSRGSNNVLEEIAATFTDTSTLGALSTKQQKLDYKDYGAFFLNHTSLGEDWQLSLGGRHSVTKGKRASSANTESEKLPDYKQFTSEVGLYYQPIEDVGLYLNYSEGFKANYQIDDLQTPLNKPELSQQVELGIKSLLLDDSFTATLAVFQIDKKNVVNIEFIEGVRGASADGKQESKGMDMDFSYQINPNINLLGALSLIDPNILTGDNKDNTPILAAKKVASAFVYYRFNQGWNKGLSFNLGSYYVGERYANSDNNIHSRLAPFNTIDFGSAYEWNAGSVKYNLQLSIKNAFDKNYLLAAEGRIRSNQGSERRAIATLSIHF